VGEIATTIYHTSGSGSKCIARTIVREKCVEKTFWESSAFPNHRGRLAVGFVRKKNVEDPEGPTRKEIQQFVSTHDVPAVVWASTSFCCVIREERTIAVALFSTS
jgi:hypothetical protein